MDGNDIIRYKSTAGTDKDLKLATAKNGSCILDLSVFWKDNIPGNECRYLLVVLIILLIKILDPLKNAFMQFDDIIQQLLIFNDGKPPAAF